MSRSAAARGGVGASWRSSRLQQSGLVRHLDRIINISGDSRTANCHSGSAPNEVAENYGWAPWLCPYTDGLVNVSRARNGGVGGDTSTMWLSRMPAIIANGGDAFFNLIGTNDRGAANMTLAQSQSNLLTGLAMQRDAGKKVVVIAELPRGGASPLSGQQLSNHLAYREWQLSVLPGLGYLVADPWPDMVSLIPSEAAAGLPRPGLFHDGLHPGPSGARIIGFHAAQQAKLLFSRKLELPTSEQAYNASTAPSGNYGTNSLMSGTAGIKNAAANAVGDLADDWRLSASSWTGGAVVLGREANPGGGLRQTMTISGTVTALNSYMAMEQILPLTLAAGKKIKVIARVLHQGLSGICGVSLDIRFVRGGTAYYMRSLDRYQDTTPMDGELVDGPQETPVLTLDGTETDIRARLVIYGCQNIPMSGVVKFAQAKTVVVA